MKKLHLLGALASLALVSSVRAQSFNIDLGDSTLPPSPANAYAAAPPQAGFWNTYTPLLSDPLSLVDVAGQPSGVAIALTASNLASESAGDNLNVDGDDAALLEDHILCQSAVWDLTGLSDGGYTVYTYAWSPDTPGRQTQIEVAGSAEGPQIVGASDWSGMHELGVTYARHTVSVSGGSLTLSAVNVGVNVGTINGFQLIPDGAITDCNANGVPDDDDLAAGTSADANGNGVPDECDGPGTKHCVGAANSFDAAGASLFVEGSAIVALDDLRLHTYRVPNTVGMYFYGPTRVQHPFGDGLRCVGGQIQRVQPPLSASNNQQIRMLDLSAAPHSARITPGVTLSFQLWYRDAQAGASGFNFSDAAEVAFH